MGLRVAEQALSHEGQHEVRGESRGVCDDLTRLLGLSAVAEPPSRRGGEAPRRRAGEAPDQSNAAPTMIFLMSSQGDPCEIEFVCVGCPLASPPVPNFC